MVRKRSNPDSETKMPVKTSPKEKSEAQRVSHFTYFSVRMESQMTSMSVTKFGIFLLTTF